MKKIKTGLPARKNFFSLKAFLFDASEFHISLLFFDTDTILQVFAHLVSGNFLSPSVVQIRDICFEVHIWYKYYIKKPP